MAQVAENCPEFVNIPELEKPSFIKGWACGYTSGLDTGKSPEYMSTMSKRLIPLYGGIGFLIGLLTVLTYLKFS